jgi:hypothetical protein
MSGDPDFAPEGPMTGDPTPMTDETNDRRPDMSAHEVREFVYKCDFCGHSVRRESLPGNWRTVIRKTHDCGLTGYTDTETLHACPSCPDATDSEAWS